jgi:hypothetical protein
MLEATTIDFTKARAQATIDREGLSRPSFANDN